MSYSLSNALLQAFSSPTATNSNTISQSKINRNEIGPYKFIKTIGEGAFFRVKAAELTEQPDKKYALKYLNSEHRCYTSNSVLEQAQNETRCLQALDHPNIIKLIDSYHNVQFTSRYAMSYTSPLLVLEYAEAGDLCDLIRYTTEFNEKHASRIFIQLFHAIQHCHSKQICHSDLKPEQILINSNYSIQLADFGFAKQFATTNSLVGNIKRHRCGTQNYMAPEVYSNTVEDSSNFTPFDSECAIDLYGLGICLFIILTSFPPFFVPNSSQCAWFRYFTTNRTLFWEKINARLRKEATINNNGLSENVIELLNGLLEENPVKRWNQDKIKTCEWFREYERIYYTDTTSLQEYNMEMRRRIITMKQELGINVNEQEFKQETLLVQQHEKQIFKSIQSPLPLPCHLQMLGNSVINLDTVSSDSSVLSLDDEQNLCESHHISSSTTSTSNSSNSIDTLTNEFNDVNLYSHSPIFNSTTTNTNSASILPFLRVDRVKTDLLTIDYNNDNDIISVNRSNDTNCSCISASELEQVKSSLNLIGKDALPKDLVDLVAGYTVACNAIHHHNHTAAINTPLPDNITPAISDEIPPLKLLSATSCTRTDEILMPRNSFDYLEDYCSKIHSTTPTNNNNSDSFNSKCTFACTPLKSGQRSYSVSLSPLIKSKRTVHNNIPSSSICDDLSYIAPSSSSRANYAGLSILSVSSPFISKYFIRNSRLLFESPDQI